MEFLYWVAQSVFLAAFVLATTSGYLSTPVLAACAAAQLIIVGWRLMAARRQPWLALLPPITTMAIWYGLGHWAVYEDRKLGGDGAGLMAVMAAFAWCVLAYVGLGIWAGLQQPKASENRPSAP
jgi:hypothetical protein